MKAKTGEWARGAVAAVALTAAAGAALGASTAQEQMDDLKRQIDRLLEAAPTGPRGGKVVSPELKALMDRRSGGLVVPRANGRAFLVVDARGAGDGLVAACAAEDLDALEASALSPSQCRAVCEAVRPLGLEAARPVTYAVACRQGWAPPPTNDIQRAIWEKVHQIPDKPIKIEFDPKRGR